MLLPVDVKIEIYQQLLCVGGGGIELKFSSLIFVFHCKGIITCTRTYVHSVSEKKCIRCRKKFFWPPGSTIMYL